MGLKVENVSKQGEATSDFRLEILDGISFAADKGGITLILGRSGSGKSTLLDVAGGLSVPDQGSVWVDGESLWHQNSADRNIRRKLAMVFQQPEEQLFAATVQREFDYTLKPQRLSAAQADKRIREALQQMGLGPNLLGQSPHELSGGTKRRVALSVVFAAAPEWLLLDEPTAGLDHEAAAGLVRTVRTWTHRTGGGALIATHDLDAFLPVADRIVMLSRGRVVHDCTRDELARHPELLRDAGLQPPEALALGSWLRRHGAAVPPGWPAPAQMARAAAQALRASAAWSGQGITAPAGGAVILPEAAGSGGRPAPDEPAGSAAPGHGAARADSVPAGGLGSKQPAEAKPALQEPEEPAVHVQGASNTGSLPDKRPADDSLAAPVELTAAQLPARVPGAAPGFQQCSGREQEYVSSSLQPGMHAGAVDAKPTESCELNPSGSLKDANSAVPIGHRLDPRTFWIGYILLSAGILMQRTPAGLAAAAIVTAVAVLLSRVPLAVVWRPLRAFLIFMLISGVIAGISLPLGSGGSRWVSFNPGAALEAVRGLLGIMLVLILGVLFPQLIGYLRMKRGVEQGLHFLTRFKLPVEAVALTASLMFRFIPLIQAQWVRFGRIARARGQGRSRKAGIGLGEFRIMAIPFVVSLIRMADEFSTALELRGYSRTGEARTRSFTLQMQKSDYKALFIFVLVFILLFLVKRLSS
ncbi:ATP-binding cassette domain-containing protein [Paenibacillus lutrae]|uniref:ATP-binding cassette domain-containing protein n=1 Tax=Paenibacillus lutrae TaxID=2078573 RepID=A0A7X3FI86_9BACL|nr:ATP-binding cassette domain-containing protein [Paenibacillus lutrae]MVP00135.1 ATP-binding cassette domain-containing protein [Paenibacillus lutrae]